ncbi:ATP-binding cassette subfamily G member 4-like isoform X2 [Rhodnius prolixus]
MAEQNLPEMGKYLAQRTPVDVEFSDLTYTVPIGRNSSKLILRNVSGLFKSGELTAILGPSGAGKSTLLNVLAGYRRGDGTGSVLINGAPRDIKLFRKLSRYIMQEDVHQAGVTVFESVMISANLKLGPKISNEYKTNMALEILDLLRLTKCKDTLTTRLSGGEKKRLSIAVELVNNPSVLFLDEPTTGLDDLSSSQCISLLKSLARGGRTVICSIHTPSAKLFALFDNVYIVADGQCIFQGLGEDIVPFLSSFGLNCPKHYNPADFMVEVSSGEYGYYLDRMMNAVDNGRCKRWNKPFKTKEENPNSDNKLRKVEDMPDYGCSTWTQFTILLGRMFLQTWRNWTQLAIKIIMHILVGLLIGALFFKMGNDGSKTLYNFGFCFISMIVFMYIPMLPALVWFPMEVQMLKREHFNRWYGLNSYFSALTLARLPLQLICTAIYVLIVYTMSAQPFEFIRIFKFSFMLTLIALASEAMGLAISSRLDIVNGIFVGPAMSVPFMLLAAYSFGNAVENIPMWIRVGMYGSYLRFGIEGLVMSIYGGPRPHMICPDEEIYCHWNSPKALIKELGMENAEYWFAVILVAFYLVLFKVICYVILRQRLKRSRSSGLVWLVGRFIKRYFNLAH